MEPDDRKWGGNQVIRDLSIFTFLLAVMPFITYIIAVLVKAIPSYQEWKVWYATEGIYTTQTAPWWKFNSPWFLICCPMSALLLLLPLFTLFIGAELSSETKMRKWFLSFLGLAIIQFALGLIQLATLSWLIW